MAELRPLKAYTGVKMKILRLISGRGTYITRLHKCEVSSLRTDK